MSKLDKLKGEINNDQLDEKISNLNNRLTSISDIVASYSTQLKSDILTVFGNTNFSGIGENVIKTVNSIYANLYSGTSPAMKYLMLEIEKGCGFSNALDSIKKALSTIDFSRISRLSGYDSKILDKYYWVIPFEYKYEEIEDLSKLSTRMNFEKKMLKYFNTKRTKKLLSEVRKNCDVKNKKELMKQVEKAYFKEDYAICIVSLVTLLDGLTLQLIDPNSENQHLSYKVINDLLEYMQDAQINQFGYELYVKVDILNNFYSKLYRFEALKTPKSRLLSRHLIAHGAKYPNKQIEVLRLLNAIYFCQEIIDESKLQEQFTKEKKDKKYKLVIKKNM